MASRSAHGADYLTLGILACLILFLFPAIFQFITRLPLHLFPSKAAPPRSLSVATDLRMSWFQKTISLPSRSKGSYLITDHVLKEIPEIKDYRVGMLHLQAHL